MVQIGKDHQRRQERGYFDEENEPKPQKTLKNWVKEEEKVFNRTHLSN